MDEDGAAYGNAHYYDDIREWRLESVGGDDERYVKGQRMETIININET